MPRTLTTANSTVTLTINTAAFPIPVVLSGYATDDAFASEEVNLVETRMGVDGKLSFGYTPYPVPLRVVLQADSTSNDIFDTWRLAMLAIREVITCGAEVSITGISKKYEFVSGTWTRGLAMPQGQKIAGPQTYNFMFESMIVSPI